MNLKTCLAGLAVLSLMSGCSQQTQKQVEATGAAVVADVKENAKDVVAVTTEAAAGAEVTTKVKAALVASTNMDTTALNVDTVNGVVFLRGWVPSEEQKKTAEEIAKNTVASGTTITNELVVGPPDGADTPAVGGTPGIIDDGHNDEDHTGHDHAATPHPAEDHTGHDHVATPHPAEDHTGHDHAATPHPDAEDHSGHDH